MAFADYLPKTDFVSEMEYDEKRHEALLDMAIELKNKGDPNWRVVRDAADKYERDMKGTNPPGESTSMSQLGAAGTGAAQEFTWGASDNLAAGAAAMRDMVQGDTSAGTGFLDRYRKKVHDYGVDRTIKKTLYPQTYAFGQGTGLAASLAVPLEEVAGGVANVAGKVVGAGETVGRLVNKGKAFVNESFGHLDESAGKAVKEFVERFTKNPQITNRGYNMAANAVKGGSVGIKRGGLQGLFENDEPATNLEEIFGQAQNIGGRAVKQGLTGLTIGAGLGALDSTNPNILEAKSAAEKAKLNKIYKHDYEMTPDEVRAKLNTGDLQRHHDVITENNLPKQLQGMSLRGKPLHEAHQTLQTKADDLNSKIDGIINNVPLADMQNPTNSISAMEILKKAAPNVIEKKQLDEMAGFLDGVNVNPDHKLSTGGGFLVNGNRYDNNDFTLQGVREARQLLDKKMATFKDATTTAGDLETRKALTQLRSALNSSLEDTAQSLGTNLNNPAISEIRDDITDLSKVLNSKDIIDEAVHRKGAELAGLPETNVLKDIAYQALPLSKYHRAREIESMLDITGVDDIIRGKVPSYFDRFSPTVNVPRALAIGDEADKIKKAMDKYTGDRSIPVEQQPEEWQKKNKEMNVKELEKEQDYLKGTRLQQNYIPNQSSTKKKRKGNRWGEESTNEWLTDDVAAGFRLTEDEDEFSFS